MKACAAVRSVNDELKVDEMNGIHLEDPVTLILYLLNFGAICAIEVWL